MIGPYKVIAVIGNTRFYPDFQEAVKSFTLTGNICLSCGDIQGPMPPEKKVMLDAMRRAKIDFADMVYVVNPYDKLEPDLLKEVEYARKEGKEVKFKYPHQERKIFYEIKEF